MKSIYSIARATQISCFSKAQVHLVQLLTTFLLNAGQPWVGEGDVIQLAVAGPTLRRRMTLTSTHPKVTAVRFEHMTLNLSYMNLTHSVTAVRLIYIRPKT